MKTKQKVRVVFADESIKKRDQKLNEKILKYLEGMGNKYEDRVSFEVGVKQAKNWKTGYVFIDEIDAVMFEDLEQFYKATKYKDLKVIGLTATAFAGHEEGSEREALNLLGYKLYRNSDIPDSLKPEINDWVSLILREEWDEYLFKKADLQPILIYATGFTAETVRAIRYVQEVTEKTDHEKLA